MAAGEKLRTISGENIARMKSDFALPETNTLAKDTLSRIKTRLGTNYVILGSYLVIGSKIRLDLRLQDTDSEKLISIMEEGTESELLDLVSRTGTRLRKELGTGEITPVQAAAVRASLPADPEGARFYADGLGRLRAFDYLQAKNLLIQSTESDPNFPLAHSALSEAWSGLGYDQKAKEEAKRANDLASNLSREEALSIRARYYLSTNEWDKAVDTYKVLSGFFPDDLEYGLRLAEAQNAGGKPAEAIATIEALHKLPPPATSDPRIDLAEANLQPDWKRAQAAEQKAYAKAKSQGSELLAAQARMKEAWIFYFYLPKRNEARAIFQEVRETYAKAGDHNHEADALMGVARVYKFEAKLAEAMKIYQQILALHRKTGNTKGIAETQTYIANIYRNQGNYAMARKATDEALALYREIQSKSGESAALYQMGAVFATQGNHTQAIEKFEESLSLDKEMGSTDTALTFNIIGLLQVEQGDLAAAQKNLEESLSSARKYNNNPMVQSVLCAQGDVLLKRGDLAGARKKFDQAAATGDMKESRIYLALNPANLLFEEGKFQEAEKLVRELAQSPRIWPNEKVAVWNLLARSLLAQGKKEKAQTAMNQALAYLKEHPDPGDEVLSGITRARILAASGKPSDVTRAIKNLKAIVAETAGSGQLEARLALGEIELRSENPAAGRATLQALEKDATAKGFLLIARKAAALTRLR